MVIRDAHRLNSHLGDQLFRYLFVARQDQVQPVAADVFRTSDVLMQTVLGKHVDGVRVELAGDVPYTLKSPPTTNLLPSSIIWSSMSDSWSVKVDVTVPGWHTHMAVLYIHPVQLVITRLKHHMANSCTKFEVSSFSHSRDISGGVKY